MKNFLLIFPGTLLLLFGTIHVIKEANAAHYSSYDLVSPSGDYNYSLGLKARDEKEKITRFLTEMHDARLMDTEEGQLASERGTTDAIKQYGLLMINDQALLDQKLKDLAAMKGLTLSSSLSPEKADGLADLKELTGQAFDKKFKRMMKKDHKRDIKCFKKASKLNDVEVNNFAEENLPLIESHLIKLKKL